MTEEICRICLQPVSENDQTITESLLKTITLNLNISQETVMCIACANHLKIFSNFKEACVYKRARTLPVTDLKNETNLNPVEIETISDLKPLVEIEIECSLCAKTSTRDGLVPLKESKQNESLVNMMKQHIPRMYLNDTEELLTCETCLDTLQSVPSFIFKWLEVEDNINKYTKIEETDANYQIEIKDIKQIAYVSPTVKHEIEPFSVNELEEGEYAMAAKTEIKYEKDIENSELIIKTEDVDIKSEQSNCDGFQEIFVDNKIVDDPLEMLAVTPQTSRIKLNGQDVLKMFKCCLCSFESKWKVAVKRHLLIHKSSSEVTMFVCQICSFETKHKNCLKNHLLTHKSPSELTMFECEMCSFKTKFKETIKKHSLTHKSPSEINMFKCTMCSYETKRKDYLSKHLLIHKNPLEINMFKCEMCSFETKRKDNLKKHLLTHKSSTEVTMFKCDICSFETKRKETVRKHLLIHKNPSEINMFKCPICSFNTKRAGELRRHIMTHKSSSEITMFKCHMCSYEAKHKNYLNRHLLTHNISSQKNLLKCTLCTFETKYKSRLRKHLLIHKDAS